MKVIQTQANIVVLANSHNPTIVTKEWLSENKVFTESVDDFTHTPHFSVVHSRTFMLFVDPNRLHVDVKIFNEESLSRLPKVIERYGEKLPEVPYSAVGFNSRWEVHDVPGADMLKAMFTGNSQLFTNVFGPQHNVGGVVSWTYGEFQVRLTANPAEANLGIDFNYHSDIKTVDDLYGRLTRFADVTAHSHSTVSRLLGGDNVGYKS